MTQCHQTPGCQGIEYRSEYFGRPISRCEVWLKPIRSFEATNGFQCFRYTLAEDPMVLFDQVDDADRACQGVEGIPQEDVSNSLVHDKVHDVVNCLSRCRQFSKCYGVTFTKRADDWKGQNLCMLMLQPVIYGTAASAGSKCFRYNGGVGEVPNPMAAYMDVDGGVDKLCRAEGGGNSNSFYEISTAGGKSIYACMHECSHKFDRGECRGIEYTKTYQRCELWFHPIGAAKSSPKTRPGCFRKHVFSTSPLIMAAPMLDTPGKSSEETLKQLRR